VASFWCVRTSCLVGPWLKFTTHRSRESALQYWLQSEALPHIVGPLLLGRTRPIIVLFKFGNELQTSQLQFGFKAKSSTNLCTFVLKEALSYYATNQSNVFCTFLDATKAFDRINYCKLFGLLLKRDLPACILRVLLCFYTNNFVHVS